MNYTVAVLEPVKQKVNEAPKACMIDDALANLSEQQPAPETKSDINLLNNVRQGALIGAMLASFSSQSQMPPTIGSIMPELPGYGAHARLFDYLLSECKNRLQYIFPSAEIRLRQQIDSDDGSVQLVLGIVTAGTAEAYNKLDKFKAEWWNEKRNKLPSGKTLVVKIDGKRRRSV